jgi:triphosphoribosyl-dephospho-CoA synthase
MSVTRSATDIAALVQLACLLEVSAPKPGNVSPGRHFADLAYEDFLISAVAIGQPFTRVADQGLGETIRQAVEATACWTNTNTNLGMVLLLAPLARAAAATSAGALRDAVRRVLERTTVDDARHVYAAIRRARPGGLGRSDAQDVADEPDVTLLEAMRLAADRDGVAREYAMGFEVTFERGAPALTRARHDGLSWSEAIVETYLSLLAGAVDTHIIRRTGLAAAERVSTLAVQALEAGGVRSAKGRKTVEQMDRAIRDAGNANNPGTTADLTAAAIFVTLIDGPPEGGHYADKRSVRREPDDANRT